MSDAASIEISAVPPAGVSLIAEQVLRCGRGALKASGGRVSGADLVVQCETGRCALFVAVDTAADEVLGIAVLCSVPQPRRSDLRIDFVGGVRACEWVPAMWETLKDFARSSGHDCLSYTGRKGWLRWVPELKQTAVFAEADVHGQE